MNISLTLTHIDPYLSLPLSLLSPLTLQLVELKNGETYNGNLDNCDSWMNINLKDVICTSRVRGTKHTSLIHVFVCYLCSGMVADG